MDNISSAPERFPQRTVRVTMFFVHESRIYRASLSEQMDRTPGDLLQSPDAVIGYLESCQSITLVNGINAD